MPLTTRVYWLPKNASWLDQIEIWFSILKQELYSPIGESLEELQKIILVFIDHYNQTAKPVQD